MLFRSIRIPTGGLSRYAMLFEWGTVLANSLLAGSVPGGKNMTRWRWFGSLVLMAGLVALAGSRLPVFAGDDKDLVWKAFDEKSGPFYQVLNTKTVQTMKVMNMDVKQEQDQTFYIKWTPEKQVKDNWVVKQQIIGVKMKIDIGGNKIEYDSTDEKAPKNPMSDFFEALTKAELKFHIDPKTFEVKSIEGRDEFIKKLAATNPQIDALLRAILSEGALKQMAEPTWAAFPTEADRAKESWKKDKSWERESKLDLGPIGVYTFKNNYKWGEKDKVTIKSKLEYSAQTDPKKKEGLPFTIKEGSLTGADKGDSYAEFNRAKGRFDKSKIDMKLEGKLKIDIGGMETTVELDQTQTSTVESRDDDPLQKKK